MKDTLTVIFLYIFIVVDRILICWCPWIPSLSVYQLSEKFETDDEEQIIKQEKRDKQLAHMVIRVACATIAITTYLMLKIIF